VTNIDKTTLAIISNEEVIAVNQDALGVQGHRVIQDKNKLSVKRSTFASTRFPAFRSCST
jgi:hypothetical protein